MFGVQVLPLHPDLVENSVPALLDHLYLPVGEEVDHFRENWFDLLEVELWYLFNDLEPILVTEKIEHLLKGFVCIVALYTLL